MDIRRRFNRRYGVLKGLITKYTNRGYDIDIDYTPPKKITEGSLRRLEKMIDEVRRQKDVQDARKWRRAWDAKHKVKEKIEGYYNGTILGEVGAKNAVGVADKGDALILKTGSKNDLELILEEVYNSLKTYEQFEQFADNVEGSLEYIDDCIEAYILAAYRKKTAVWSPEAGARYTVYNRQLEGYKNTLKGGII